MHDKVDESEGDREVGETAHAALFVERSTFALKPLIGLMEILEEPETPTSTVIVAGSTASVKSGCRTVT
jgi:hypothetical protein